MFSDLKTKNTNNVSFLQENKNPIDTKLNYRYKYLFSEIINNILNQIRSLFESMGKLKFFIEQF